MRSVLVCAGQRLPPHHQTSTGTGAAAAAAGLLSRAAYRLAGFGGLLDPRGRAQLAALAGFGVVVDGSAINHHHSHHAHYRPTPHQLAALPNPGSVAHRSPFLPPAPVFTPADLHLVLYGYARSRADDDDDGQKNATTHSLSGLRINELSYGILSTLSQLNCLPLKKVTCVFHTVFVLAAIMN